MVISKMQCVTMTQSYYVQMIFGPIIVEGGAPLKMQILLHLYNFSLDVDAF